jgi:hypothetical protein
MDQFKSQQWEKPDIWTSAFRNSTFSNSNNFNEVSSTEKYQYPKIRLVEKTYDILTTSRMIKQLMVRNDNVRHMKLPTVQNADAEGVDIAYGFQRPEESPHQP